MRISPKPIGILLGCAIGLPLLALGILWVLETSAQLRPVTADIRFIGYTNTMWGHMAQMRVQNTSDFPIALAGLPGELQIKSRVGWKHSQISIPLHGNVIAPGQSEVIEFATPVLTNAWRMEVGYHEYESKKVRSINALLRKIGLGQSTKVWMVESELVTP